MKKIVVTGANGQLGSELREISGTSGHNFVFTDIDTLDLLNRKDTDAFFAEQQPDVIINCAAYTNVDKAEDDKENAALLNAELPARLAEYSRKSNGMLIHISTDYIFSGRHHKPIREDEVAGPESVYGKTKLQGENSIKDLGNVIIIRTSWLYSSYGNNFVKSMIRLLGERKELGIVFDQVGTPTYGADLAAAIMKIIDDPSAGNLSGIYHYSNEGVSSWFDFAYEIKEILNSDTLLNPIETAEYPRPAPRPHYSVMSKDKIKNTFGIEIPHWKQSLKQCMKIINP